MPSTPSVTKPAATHSETRRPSIFWVLAGIAIPVISTFTRFRLVNGKKLPRQGAYIIAPNHYSEIDPVLVGAAVWKLGRAPRFLAKGGLFRVPVLGWLLRASGQVPVERAGSDRRSDPLGAAHELVAEGRTVLIYPEGTLTREPNLWPMRGKTGAARMAIEYDLPVIPVAHWGAQLILPRYSKRISVFPRKLFQVKIGDPVDLSRFRGRNLDAVTLAEATAVIMEAITALLEDLRGETAPAEQWDPSAHDQSETGRF